MNLQRQVARTLDEEHTNVLALLAKMEHAFSGADPAALRDPQLKTLAADVAAAIENEISRHFAFEEQALFPRLEEAGENDIVTLLAEEHVTLRAVAAELIPLARAASTGTLEAARWADLRRPALEMVERLRSHIEKETLGLVPLVDELIDDGLDRELALEYASS